MINYVLPYGHERESGLSMVFEAVKLYAKLNMDRGTPLINVKIHSEDINSRSRQETLEITDGHETFSCVSTHYTNHTPDTFGYAKCQFALVSQQTEPSSERTNIATILYKAMIAAKETAAGDQVTYSRADPVGPKHPEMGKPDSLSNRANL
jgi:hypothetical protein